MTFISDSTEIEFCGKDMEEAYQMGRADAIDECISKINSYISHPQLISAIRVIVRDLEKLNEQKNE